MMLKTQVSIKDLDFFLSLFFQPFLLARFFALSPHAKMSQLQALCPHTTASKDRKRGFSPVCPFFSEAFFLRRDFRSPWLWACPCTSCKNCWESKYTFFVSILGVSQPLSARKGELENDFKIPTVSTTGSDSHLCSDRQEG